MNLDISESKILNNQFIKNFMKEIKKVLGNMENKDIELTNEEEMQFSQKEFEIYRDFLGEDEYVLHRKYNAPSDDRYKIAQYEGGFEKMIVIHEPQLLDKNANIGDILIKTDDGYKLDNEKTEFIKSKLNQAKEEIILNR